MVNTSAMFFYCVLLVARMHARVRRDSRVMAALKLHLFHAE